MAGFRELLAVEWDDHAAEVFRLNFPDVPIYHGDIASLSVDDVFKSTGLTHGELDVLDGSPPCQGFSTVGKREMEDQRNRLFEEYVRLLKGLQPRVFIMENVSGMVKGKMRLIFAEILQTLKVSGYQVSARLLNAMWYGVPQSRERIIFIGVREDLMKTSNHPMPLRRPFTLREAIHDVTSDCEELEQSRYPRTTMPDVLLRHLSEGGNGADYHPRGAMFGLRRLCWNRPSRTVLREDGTGASCQCCHPIECRRLTIPELKRVGSFPDEFQMLGKHKDCWARIGNSVPPLFMRAIASHVRQEILNIEETKKYARTQTITNASQTGQGRAAHQSH